MVATIQEIEKAVASLSPEELEKFRAWFQAFDAAAWDKQIEEDAKSGKLDKVAEKALSDFDRGDFKEL
jgi:hypothetical protein